MNLTLQIKKQLGAFNFCANLQTNQTQLGLFGPSGSGKSTLLNLLAGILIPDEGEIILNDRILFSQAKRINLSPEQRNVGVVFQNSLLFPHLSVKDNLYYGKKRQQKKADPININDLLEILELTHLLDRGVNALSGGEKQRVSLARTVLSQPQLILLDEPLAALDEKLKYQIIPYLKKVFTQFSIPYLYVSHSLNEVRLMTKEVVLSNEGQTSMIMATEELALQEMRKSRIGYINLLKLRNPHQDKDMAIYTWGAGQIVINCGGKCGRKEGVFELSSKDITLFKKHPEATSARNLLHCKVARIFESGNRVGVELTFGEEKLVAQVVHQAVTDLQLEPGSDIFAMIKASAFRRVY